MWYPIDDTLLPSLWQNWFEWCTFWLGHTLLRIPNEQHWSAYFQIPGRQITSMCIWATLCKRCSDRSHADNLPLSLARILATLTNNPKIIHCFLSKCSHLCRCAYALIRSEEQIKWIWLEIGHKFNQNLNWFFQKNSWKFDIDLPLNCV